MDRIVMKISAVIPVYNGAIYLREAIDSILSQSRPANEVVILDDGSTDETPEIIASYGGTIRYHRQENCGAPAARNTALRVVTGEAIAFLDADNFWTPGRLEYLEEELQSRPEVDVVVGLVEMRDQRGRHFDKQQRKSLSTAHRLNQIDSMLLRKCIFDKIGPFDEQNRYSDDIEWYMRALEEGVQFHMLPRATVVYRLHAENMSRNTRESQHSLLSVMQRSIHRRRNRT